jgi:hypothetical protein
MVSPEGLKCDIDLLLGPYADQIYINVIAVLDQVPFHTLPKAFNYVSLFRCSDSSQRQIEAFTTAHWMWAQTTSRLVAIMYGFGWNLLAGYIVDNFAVSCGEYSLLVFAKLRHYSIHWRR